MKINNIFNCGQVKCMKTNEFCIEVDNIRIVYSMSFNFGIITEIQFKSTNYKSMCNIVFDTRKEKIIEVECIGFKADKVKLTLEECFRQEGLLYKPA
ncbi:hypothetical protein SJAV_21890 [Sulfurisphaera javensis]|uniref:Uncharacterized protein n=1 Tax=Sulfurisphaera javensis TaxID=2049879 RepID=A0AAT9GUD3_9CREN